MVYNHPVDEKAGEEEQDAVFRRLFNRDFKVSPSSLLSDAELDHAAKEELKDVEGHVEDSDDS